MNVTLSADEQLVKKARLYASEHGTSLNQLIRDYLTRLVGELSAGDAAVEFAAIASQQPGNSGGARIARDEIYSDRMRVLTHEYVTDSSGAGQNE